MLFHSHVFGPLKSRRLGVSLGINVLPNEGKLCSFDCVYCECGLNADGRGDTQLVSPSDLEKELEDFLIQYTREQKTPIDTFTFAGNGEPTLHPQFAQLVDVVASLRNKYQPKAQVSVLTNAWQLNKPEVLQALRKVDMCALKLDSALPDTVLRINRPVNPHFNMEEQLQSLENFGPEAVVQTMLVRGAGVDNTTEPELAALTQAICRIRPRQVQLYSIDRKTPIEGLQKVPVDELQAFAVRLQALGIATQVVG